ncbi:MAG: hypothetical protein KA257_05900 [Opitutaceae bacterium]|nr:hypothetical protein [Opitutaceae bacterium]MBP9911885.1 hypothetical protein [Opitutaceae bacterium]
MSAFTPPPHYPRIKAVGSFEELLATPFGDGINALCWPRTLAGDFGEIVAQLARGEGIIALDEARLNSLTLSAAGRTARDSLVADLQRLRAQSLAPELNCIHAYPRDDTAALVPTDVYSFHADSAPVPTDTWLCTYHGPASEGLRNEEAQKRVDDPAIRAALLQEYGGADDADFREYLSANSYDLHYAPLPHAQPFSFGVHHLWRIATDYPDSPVPPCIHRAPATQPGHPPRLLLIS